MIVNVFVFVHVFLVIDQFDINKSKQFV